jgi:ribosome maturation factor RimP
MQRTELISLIESTVQQHGARLVDCELGSGLHKTAEIDVFADTETGITIGEIAELSRALHRALLAFLGENADFQLTVSSPGLERPLKHAWQYARHAGRKARIETLADGARQEHEGVLIGLEGDTVRLQVGDDVRSMPLDGIVSTIIIP